MNRSNFVLNYFALIVFYFQLSSVIGEDTFLDVTMPGFTPIRDEQYVCVAGEVKNPGYVVQFLPSATADRTHHMLIYGCNAPVKTDGTAWDCEHAAMCNGNQKILYGWARNAAPLELPPNVGVPIGKDEQIGYIVVQMHYAKKFGGEVFDYSGIRLRITQHQPQYLAGIYLFLPMGGAIPPHTQNFFMNATCEYTFSPDVHPFAFRPHTHHLGRVVSAYKYSKEGAWSKIGKGNPQWPQRFYPIENPPTIHTGDILAAQCLYDSTDRDHETTLGAHGHNEMCNFYMYYYVDAKQKNLLQQFETCGFNERSDLFAQYPAEASVRFLPNPEMDETGKQTDMSFGVSEKSPWPLKELALGQIAGLAMNKEGNLVIFHRADRVWEGNTFDMKNHFQQKDKGPIADNAVVVLDKDGVLVSRWAKSFFYLPHGIFIDENDFVWLTDVAMHQVFKFDMKNEEMKPLLTLGQEFEPGSDDKHFCKPAGVAVAIGEGTVFVADGYCNNRIMKFSSDGKYIGQWGEASKGTTPNQYPALGTFNLPHGLSLDDARRRIFVADRENGRVQIFTFDGTALGQFTEKGFGETVYDMFYCPSLDTAFVINGPGMSGNDQLRVFAFDASTQKILYSWKPVNGDLKRPHTVVSSADCSYVFVGEIGPNKLWRFDIRSTGRRASVPGGKSQVEASTKVMESHTGHKPYVASDVAMENGGNVRVEMENTFQLAFVLFLTIMIPIALIVAICCYVKCRRKNYYKNNLVENGFGRKGGKNGLFSNGYRDNKGFQPLSTEDIDASDDSDDSDTLYMAQKKFGTRKA